MSRAAALLVAVVAWGQTPQEYTVQVVATGMRYADGPVWSLEDFLLFFHDATLATEGRSATIDRVLPTMDFLLEQFETAKQTYAKDLFMSPCCNSGWSKLDKYYGLTERSPVYIAALILSLQWK